MKYYLLLPNCPYRLINVELFILYGQKVLAVNNLGKVYSFPWKMEKFNKISENLKESGKDAGFKQLTKVQFDAYIKRLRKDENLPEIKPLKPLKKIGNIK